MKPRTTIGTAIAAVCLSVAGLAPAAASAAPGSLSVTPGILERAARPGPLDTVTISNTTGRAMRVGLAVRPWRQSRSGSVVPDRRRRLGLVRPGRSSFGLPPGGSRSIPLGLAGRPKRGSLYGAIEVTGAPPSRRKGPRVGYRLVSSLRLFPPAGARRFKARPKRLFARGRGPLFLAVQNAGNTIDPIDAKVTIRGRGRTLRVRTLPKTILPGRTVDLRLRRGLPRGRYKVAVRLTQAGRRVGGLRRALRLR